MARTVTLSDEAARLLDAALTAGQFPNASAAVDAALRALAAERERAEKVAALRAAITAGDDSPDAAPGVFDRIRARHGLTQSGR